MFKSFQFHRLLLAAGVALMVLTPVEAQVVISQVYGGVEMSALH
jgi:hypothetical protein